MGIMGKNMETMIMEKLSFKRAGLWGSRLLGLRIAGLGLRFWL